MKKSVFLLSVFIVLFGLTSCVSTSEITEMTPLNLYSKRKFSSENSVFFVGEGRAENQRQAELLSYVDLYNKVYSYLGLDPEPEGYMELTSNGTVSSYNLRIQEKNLYPSDGRYIYALVASADKRLLDADRSPDMKKEQEIAEKAIALVLQGDSCIKENMDVEGVRLYLQSMVYSYGLHYIEDEFSFSSILEEVLNIIKVLKIDVSHRNPEELTCRVKLTRNDSLIPSRVKNSQVVAYFPSVDARGEKFTDSFPYTTDSRGIINFVPRAYNMEKNGTVKFVLDFESELKQIESLSPFSAAAIREALESVTAGFEYGKKTETAPVVISVQAVDFENAEDRNGRTLSYFSEQLSETGVNTLLFEYKEDESVEEMLRRFKDTYPDNGILIVLRVGNNSVYETRMNAVSIGVEGSVTVYKADTGEVLYDSGIDYANGFGESMMEAQDEAFENFVLKMVNLLKAYYV